MGNPIEFNPCSWVFIGRTTPPAAWQSQIVSKSFADSAIGEVYESYLLDFFLREYPRKGDAHQGGYGLGDCVLYRECWTAGDAPNPPHTTIVVKAWSIAKDESPWSSWWPWW